MTSQTDHFVEDVLYSENVTNLMHWRVHKTYYMIIEIGHIVIKCHNISSPDTAIKLYGNVRLRHLLMICVCKCVNESMCE